jgi:molybdopterin-guanine dinucleotide biosynthesis protein A
VVTEAFVLAGGAGRRMGADKARIAWPGRWPMASWIAAILGRVVSRVRIVRAAPDPLGFAFPAEAWVRAPGAPIEVVCDDPTLPSHPLRGVAAALRGAAGPTALVAATDVVGLTEAAVRALLAAGGPAVAAAEGRFALLAVLAVDQADRVEDLVRSGGSFRDLVGGLPAVELGDALIGNQNAPPAGGPLAVLRARLPRFDRQIEEGEVGRLAARGAVDPDPGRLPAEAPWRPPTRT